MTMDKYREEELKIAEIMILGTIVLSLLSFMFWSLSASKGPLIILAEDIVMFCIMIIVFYSFYLTLFGEKKK